jgi:phospholipase/carboxylesterase
VGVTDTPAVFPPSTPSAALDDAAVIFSVPRAELASRLPGSVLLIVMHGYGSHERDLISLAAHLPAGIILASLRAPKPAPIANGYSWFTVGEPGNPDTADADASARGVFAWLDRLTTEFGVPGRIGALGFSQGGAMALHLLRHAPERILASVNLSGFAIAGDAPGDSVLVAGLPRVFWGRDVHDPVVPASAIDRTTTWLATHATTDAHLYAGIGHGISGDELADVTRYLDETLLAGLGDGAGSPTEA